MAFDYVEVNNTKLAYIAINKTAECTIFFLHGNSVSKRNWHKQYNSHIFTDYRMIAIDLPAHGNTDALDINRYTLPKLAEIMWQAITIISNNKPFIIAAVSLSTNIVAEMMAYPIKPAGLVLAGPCIAGKDYGVEKFMLPNTHVGIVFTDNPANDDIMAYSAELSCQTIWMTGIFLWKTLDWYKRLLGLHLGSL